MFCGTCGFEVEEDDSYCRKCGTPVGQARPREAAKACAKGRDGRMIAGVCVGCARYFGKDVTIVRAVWTLAAITPPIFPGVVAYVIGWLLMPGPAAMPSGERPAASGAVASE